MSTLKQFEMQEVGILHLRDAEDALMYAAGPDGEPDPAKPIRAHVYGPGSKDYGEMNLKIGNVPSDAGQVILRAAVESNDPHAFQMTYPSGEVHYISALVTSFVNTDGSVDNIQRVSVKLDLDRKPVIVAAT